jgi:hypothetical protein
MSEAIEQMQAGVAKLKKLKGKGVRELSARGRQELSKLSERLLGLSVGEMSDKSFLRHVKRDRRSASASETAARIAHRIRDSIAAGRHSVDRPFFPSLACREGIVSAMQRRFARERQAIINSAERAIHGRLSLLGFSKLKFGSPPDWLLEPVSGKRAPLDHWSRIDYLDPKVAGDKKITWELNRHQHFVTLGQAYWMTSDERYAEAFVSQAASWMDQNPPNRGINWASSLELAFRSIAWLWSVHLFAVSPRLTPDFTLRLLKHLIAHVRHIDSYLSRYFSPNTHLTGEALGLFYIGAALPELRGAEAWRGRGLKILLEQLSRQVRGDGVYFEQATYYHRYTADFYTHLLILARASGVKLPFEVEEKLGQLLTYLMWITRPDGSSPLIGDDDGGRLITLGARRLDDFRDTLATGAALLGNGEWKHAAGNAAVETLWLLGPEGLARYDEIKSEKPRASSCAFEESGYVMMRDGWSAGSTCALIDCGPHGALTYGHAHADALSLEFAALGKTWIVDPGTFTYTADASLRDLFRLTGAHNTVMVDGESQSVPAGSFSWNSVAQTSFDDFIVGDGFDYFEASHYGYERLPDPVTHTRAVICPKTSARDRSTAALPTYLIVRDVLKASKQHRYEMRYHFAPGCMAFAADNYVVVTEPGGRRLRIVVFGQSEVRASVREGWVSRAYGQREPALFASFEASGEGPQQFTTFIIPSPDSQPVRVEEQGLSYAGALGFQIVSGGARDLLLMSDGTRLIKCGPMTASSRIAWARLENDLFARSFLIGGHRLETSDGFAFRATAPVKHCSILQTEDGIEGSVTGGTLFDLTFGAPARKVVINGTRFDVGRQLAVFASDGLRWNLINAS